MEKIRNFEFEWTCGFCLDTKEENPVYCTECGFVICKQCFLKYQAQEKDQGHLQFTKDFTSKTRCPTCKKRRAFSTLFSRVVLNCVKVRSFGTGLSGVRENSVEVRGNETLDKREMEKAAKGGYVYQELVFAGDEKVIEAKSEPLYLSDEKAVWEDIEMTEVRSECFSVSNLSDFLTCSEEEEASFEQEEFEEILYDLRNRTKFSVENILAPMTRMPTIKRNFNK